MRKIILLVFIIFIGQSCKGQYLPIYGIYPYDQNVIDSIQLSFKKTNFKSIIYIPLDITKYTSILIISDEKKINYWCINDSILLTGQLTSDSIFLYRDYKKTGVLKSEKMNFKTFIPPVIGWGINTEGIIYRDNHTQFYFEYGDNIMTHKENPNRAKYRKEWLDIIRREIKDL